MDAVIYNRIWGLALPEERISTRDQERENRAWCKANGHNVIKVFTDEGISSHRFRKKKRKAWAELKDYLKPGHLLVCWEASPPSRDVAEFVKLRELCEQRGVKLAYKGRVFDMAGGDDRFMSGLDSLTSERESVIQPSTSAAVKLVATFDAVGTGQALLSPTLSWSHTIGASATAIVVAVDTWNTDTSGIIAAQVGSAPMTKLASLPSYGGSVGCLHLFGLINPPTGVQTITVTGASSSNVGNSLSYSGVASFGPVATDSGSSTTPTLSVSSAAGQMAVMAFGGWDVTFASYNQTSRYNVPWAPAVSLSFLMGDALGAATVNFTCSEVTQPWGAIGVALIP